MTDEEKKLARNAQQRDYYQRWGGREQHQRYYLKHCDKYYERARMYYQVHREERLAYQRAYNERKKPKN